MAFFLGEGFMLDALGHNDEFSRAEATQAITDLGIAGGILGLLLAGGVGTLAQSMLVGVAPIDPLAFGGTALLFGVVLAFAAWSPARRAAATDPATALRSE